MYRIQFKFNLNMYILPKYKYTVKYKYIITSKPTHISNNNIVGIIIYYIFLIKNLIKLTLLFNM